MSTGLMFAVKVQTQSSSNFVDFSQDDGFSQGIELEARGRADATLGGGCSACLSFTLWSDHMINSLNICNNNQKMNIICAKATGFKMEGVDWIIVYAQDAH